MRRFTADWLYAPTDPTTRHNMPRPTRDEARADRLPKPHEVRLTKHAIERYANRARSGLTPCCAEHELRRKLVKAHIQWLPPAWASMAIGEVSRNRAYALVDDGVCLPLRSDHAGPGFVAPTCVVRGFASDEWLLEQSANRQNRGLAMAVAVTA